MDILILSCLSFFLGLFSYKIVLHCKNKTFDSMKKKILFETESEAKKLLDDAINNARDEEKKHKALQKQKEAKLKTKEETLDREKKNLIKKEGILSEKLEKVKK